MSLGGIFHLKPHLATVCFFDVFLVGFPGGFSVLCPAKFPEFPLLYIYIVFSCFSLVFRRPTAQWWRGLPRSKVERMVERVERMVAKSGENGVCVDII